MNDLVVSMFLVFDLLDKRFCVKVKVWLLDLPARRLLKIISNCYIYSLGKRPTLHDRSHFVAIREHKDLGFERVFGGLMVACNNATL